MEYSENNEFKFILDYENNIGIKFPLQLYVNQRYESFFRDFEVEVIDLFLAKISTLSQMDEAVHIFHLIPFVLNINKNSNIHQKLCV